MALTDLEQTFREALVTILDAAAEVKEATGRATGVQVVEFGQWAESDAALPLLVYDLVGFDKSSGEISLALSAVANGGNAARDARRLLRAGSAALTCAAFLAQSLDVARFDGARNSVILGDEDRGLERQGTPDLYQADETIAMQLLTVPD
jgi:hypothetical protein